MMAAIKKWFAPPVFEGDEEKTRRASFLNLTILIFLSFLGFLILGSLFAGTIRAGIGLTVSFLFCVVLFLYYLLQHGKVALAGTGMLILVFLAIVIVEIINGTVRVPATLGYLFVIITAGVLFEWRGTLLSICICSLAVLGLILAENADMLPQSVHIIPLANWITYTWLFGLIGAVSFWGQLNTQHALGRAEQEIKARERVELDLRKLARAVEQSPASIVITDLDGNIEYVNPRFTQVTGYSSEEAAGKNPRFLKTNLTAPETHIQLWQTITQGKEWHGEFVNRKKDGTLYYESATISPIADLHGSVLLYMAIKEDVTERKQVEAALVKTALEREAALEKVSKYKLELELQNEEKAQRAAELLIANQELTFQNEEKAKRAAELLIAIQELTFQNEEKAKRAAELLVAIQELAFQNTEKAKRAAELLIANQELAFQNTEKAKRAAELLIANLGLTYQNEEKEKRAAELGIANQELVFQNEEKIKRAAELDLVNAYLENLINYANAPIIVWDPQFRITRFNHAFEFLTGRIEADVLGQSLEILFPATSIEKSMAQIQATLDGERWESVEIEILHRDASIRTVLWNSATLFEPDGKTVLATIAQGQDITRRKQVEAALTNTNRTLEETAIQRQAALEKVSKYKTELEAQNTELYDKQTQLEALRKRYFGLYDLAPVGYCTLCKKGLILEANLTAATLLGATRESMLNFPMSRFIGKNYQDQYTFHRKKFVETGASRVVELQMVKQDGTIFWAQLETSFSLGDNKEPQARVLISDISERKAIENLLQDAEKRLSTLAEYSQALTWEVDAEGLYTYISPTCLSILGYTPDEIIAKKYFYDLHPEEGRAAFKAAAFEFFDRQLSFRNLENMLQAKDGREIWVSTNALPILDENGKLTGYRGVDTDITERKHAEDAMHESNALLSAFMQYSPMYIFIKAVTPTSSRVLKVSENYLDMVGIPAADLIGKSMEELFPLELAAQMTADDWAVVSSGEVLKLDEEFNSHIYSSFKFPFSVGERTLLAGYSLDITERKRIELDLAQTAARLSLAVRAGGVGTWEYDIINDRLTWDDQMYRLYGINAQDFSGAYDAWRQGLHPQDRERGDNEIQAALRGEKEFDAEFRVVWPDGSVHDIRALALVQRDSAGEPLSMLGTNWDVSAQKLTQAALLQSEQRYRVVAEWSPYAIVVHRDGKIIYVNPAALRMFGASSTQDLVGSLIYDRIHPDSHQKVRARLKKSADEGGGASLAELQYLRLDGTTVYAETQGMPILYDGLPAIYAVLADISERKQAQEALRYAHWKLESTIEGTQAGTWEWNVQTGEMTFNEIWAQIVGYSLAELVPTSLKTWEMLVHPNDLIRAGELFAHHFMGKLPYYYCELRMKHKDGHWVWIQDRGQVITWTEDNKPLLMFGTHTDISVRKASEEKIQLLNLELEELALTDFLTNLSNRRYFMLRGTEAVKRIMRNKEPLALIMLDIDLFKKVNDNYGHEVGDWALQHVAAVLKSSLREVDTLARIGGEEFAILLPNTGHDDAAVLAERIRKKIQDTPFDTGGQVITITISLGAAVFEKGMADIDDLLRNADAALYEAKRSGRNCVVIFGDKLPLPTAGGSN